MLPFGVTIPATVLQMSEIPELLVNYPVQLAYLSILSSHTGSHKINGRGIAQSVVVATDGKVSVSIQVKLGFWWRNWRFNVS
jgi:predicted alternative tryptophan synthase beta-subunit